MLKVNLGCGLSVSDSWINYDASPTLRLQRLRGVGKFFKVVLEPKFPDLALFGDVVAGLPLENHSVDFVYSSHMLEHLALDDFRIALQEIRRVLKPNGVFRSVIPDLEVSMRRYAENGEPNAASEFMRNTLLGLERRPKGLLEKSRTIFGNAQHLWMWDYKGIREELEVAGFSDIARVSFSDNFDFQEVEDYERWKGSLGFECRV